MTSASRKVGHYEIVRQIGRGGMAIVYLARQTALDRDVALKELSTFHASAPEMAERFLRESRLAGSLNHPNIVTVLEYFEDDGVPYIAMEYVPRGSLRPYVGSLSFAQLAGVLEGVLAGLAHAGGYGIVHRDLKPENIMVTGDGRVKIADFGIAKATQSAGTGAFLTATGTTVGTPTYMAPEQAMAQDIGLWTDLYSVGVMAWEHVVGRVPFHDTEAPMVILMRHVNEQIPSAIDVNPEADPELSAWIERLLVKDPAERTRSPVGAWDELEEIVIGRLGPRWRREARLPSYSAMIDTPRPLTPAPFQSTRARTPEPTMRPADSEPATATQESEPTAAAQADSGYLTFGPAKPASGTPPEISTATPPPSETETPPVVASAQLPAVAPDPTPPAIAPPAEPAPSVSTPPSESIPPVSAPPSEPTYLTFAGTPGRPEPVADPVAPLELPEPTAPAEAPDPVIPEAPEPDALTEAPRAVVPAPAETETPPSAPTLPSPPTPVQTETSAPAPPSARPDMATPLSVTQPSPIAPAAPAPPERRRSSKVSGPAAIVALVGVIAGAGAGFALAPSSGSSTHAAAFVGSASVGPIAVSLPAGWRRQPPPQTPNVKLGSELAVGPSAAPGGVLVLGLSTPTDATLLPARLKSALPKATSPQVVSLGPGQYYRYAGLASGASSAAGAVYALPTSAGAVIGMCLPSANAASFLGRCEQVLASLQLTSGKVLGLGPSSGFASALSGVIKQLNTAVGTGGSRLQSAAKPAAQVSAANELASAYARAAKAVKGLAAGPATPAAAALASALERTAAAYSALGTAAQHNNGRGYSAAEQAITSASGALSAAFAQLAKLGYISG